jgi:hypothetical protein
MSPWGTAPLLACVGDRTPPRRSEWAFKVLALRWVQIAAMLISLASAPARARIQLMTSCWSVRYPNAAAEGPPDPEHIAALASEHGLEMANAPWMDDVIDRYGLTPPPGAR